MHGLSQEIRLAPKFCSDNNPLDFFETSSTNLADLYYYLVPESDEDETLDITTSQVSSLTLTNSLHYSFFIESD